MLVSVVVVTYNSAAYVLETLDSIAAQTYPELELIITDDCSKDNTVEVCRKWLDQHKGRFVRTELLTVEKNTGIAGNCNRGYSAARGEWIKGIAGDDILYNNCIELCVQFAGKHVEKIYLGYLQEFGGSSKIDKPKKKFETADSKRQLDMVLSEGLCVAAPSCFCKKALWAEQGGFDENYPLFEDLPFYVNVLLSGERIGIIPEVYVKYRVHNNSISRNGGYSKSRHAWLKDVLFPLQKKHKHFLACWHTALTVWRMDSRRAPWVNLFPLRGLWLLLDPIALQKCISRLAEGIFALFH